MIRDVIDIGAAGVITREKAAELSNAKKSDAVDVEMPLTVLCCGAR